MDPSRSLPPSASCVCVSLDGLAQTTEIFGGYWQQR
jgi:hypothetical protein